MSPYWMFMLKLADVSNNEVNVCSSDPQTALNIKFPTFFSTFIPSWHQLVTDFFISSESEPEFTAPLC